MDILLGLVIVIALLFLLPSFSTIREWNKRNPNMIIILLLLVIGIGLLFFVPELLLTCVVIGGLLYWWNLQNSNKASGTDYTKHYFSGSQAKRNKSKSSEFNSNSSIRATEKEPSEQNQKLPLLGRMKCAKCGMQLFLTQPFTYRRQSHKFWCLRCYDQSKREDALTQETVEEQKTNLPQSTKHEVSEVPTMDDFMRPILEYASQRSRSFALREITDAMADHFNLSAQARAELTGGGNIDRVYDRTSWSISHLKHAEFLRQVGRGRYEITDAGEEEAKSSNEISVSYLMQNVPAYQQWKQSRTSKAGHVTKRKEAEEEHTASERLYERAKLPRMPMGYRGCEPEYKQIEFDSKLLQMLEEARSEGKTTCDIVSKDLHDRVVVELKIKRIPMACNAMWKLWERQGSDMRRVINDTPSGHSSTISIRFETFFNEENNKKIPQNQEQEKFDSKLFQMLQQARSEGKQFCTIVSQHLHNLVVFSWQTSRMPMARNAMWRLWEKQGSHEERILKPRSKDETFSIRIIFDTRLTEEDEIKAIQSRRNTPNAG